MTHRRHRGPHAADRRGGDRPASPRRGRPRAADRRVPGLHPAERRARRGDVQANSYQHRQFLQSQIQARGYRDHRGGRHRHLPDGLLLEEGEVAGRAAEGARSASRTTRPTAAGRWPCCRSTGRSSSSRRGHLGDLGRHRREPEGAADRAAGGRPAAPFARRPRRRRNQHELRRAGEPRAHAATPSRSRTPRARTPTCWRCAPSTRTSRGWRSWSRRSSRPR